MLRTWNAENINLGPSQRGGSKSFKALGDAGQGSSENPPLPSGKGMLQQQQQQQRKLKPLGSYSENAPPSAAKGKASKTGGLGLGLVPTSSSKPQQKQRRALGDISNAGKSPAGGSGNAAPAKLSGKQPTPGLSFAVHSDAAGKAAGGGAGTAKARGSSGSRVAAAVKGRRAARPEEHVDGVEVVLGRTGDEEEVLVERKAEQRAAASALKYATRSRSSRSRSRSRSQSTSSAFAKPSAPASKTRFGRDITNTAAATGGVAAGAAAGACGVAACGAGALDKSLDSAIDRICFNDFEEGKMEMAIGGKESARTLLEDDGDMDMGLGLDMDMDSLAMALEGQNLDSFPDGLVDDEGFLTQEMELSLSFV